ncbi:hypothetical protein HK405_001921, partial [Cladochytrium tenue]
MATGTSAPPKAVPSSEEEADETAASTAAESPDGYVAPEAPRARSASATDAKAIYSHQSAFAAAAAKRTAAAKARAAARKGRVPTVTKARDA